MNEGIHLDLDTWIVQNYYYESWKNTVYYIILTISGVRAVVHPPPPGPPSPHLTSASPQLFLRCSRLFISFCRSDCCSISSSYCVLHICRQGQHDPLSNNNHNRNHNHNNHNKASHSLRRACLQPMTNTENPKPRPLTANAKKKERKRLKLKLHTTSTSASANPPPPHIPVQG